MIYIINNKELENLILTYKDDIVKIEEVSKKPSRYLILQKIIEVVCDYYFIDKQFLFGKSKITPFPEARKMFAFVAINFYFFGQSEIVQLLDVYKKNHTVINCMNKSMKEMVEAEKRIGSKMKITKKVEEITKILQKII